MSGGSSLTAQQVIENERTKLLATLLNTVAGSLVTTGILAPVAGFLLGTAHVGPWGLVVASLATLTLAAGAHAEARRTLGRLQV
jgi:hypothetical protein